MVAAPIGGYRVRCGLRRDPPGLDQAAESLWPGHRGQQSAVVKHGRTLTLIGGFISI
jgi:hypothetical protein